MIELMKEVYIKKNNYDGEKIIDINELIFIYSEEEKRMVDVAEINYFSILDLTFEEYQKLILNKEIGKYIQKNKPNLLQNDMYFITFSPSEEKVRAYGISKLRFQCEPGEIEKMFNVCL